MQYISTEGLLIDTVNKEARILGVTNTVSSNSVAFLGDNNNTSFSSISFGGTSNNSSNNALTVAGSNNVVDGSLSFDSTNSQISSDSVDFKSINLKSQDGSVSFKTNSSSLTASLGIQSSNDVINNNSAAILSKNNNINNSSVAINSINNTLNLSSFNVLTTNSNTTDRSALFNSLSTTATLSSVGILANFSNIQNSSVVLNSLSSNTNNKSIEFLGNNNTVTQNSLGINSTNTNVNNNSVSIGGTNNVVSVNSLNINSSASNITNQSKGLFLDKTVLDNNSFSIGGSGNNIRNSSIGINPLSSNILESSIGIYTVKNTVDNKSFAANTDTTTVNLSSLGINVSESNINNQSEGIYLNKTNVNNNSIAIGSDNTNVSNRSVVLNTTNSNVSSNSYGVFTNNTNLNLSSFAIGGFNNTLANRSFGINSNTSNISSNSVGIYTTNTNVNLSSFAVGGRNNTVVNNSFGLNSLNSNISGNSIGINVNSSNLLLSSLGINSLNSSITSGFAHNSISVQSISSIALNTTNSQLSSSVIVIGNNNAVNNSVLFNGNNNLTQDNSVAISSNSNNLSANAFSTLSNTVTARRNATVFNSTNSVVSSNAIQINGINNNVDNNSISILGSTNTITLTSVGIVSDVSRINNNSTNINSLRNIVSARSVSINTDSTTLIDKGIAIGSLNSNVSTGSISFNSNSVILQLSGIDISGRSNTVQNRSTNINGSNNTVQNDSATFNTINSTASANSLIFGGGLNRSVINSLVMNSSGSRASDGSSIIGGRSTSANLSSAAINTFNSQINGINSLVLGGSGHNFRSGNSVYLGGKDNEAASTYGGTIIGDRSVIIGGEKIKIGSESIAIGGLNNNLQNTSIIIGGSANDTASFKNVVIIGRGNVTANRDDIVYLPEINALGNLTISGNISAAGTFTNVSTTTGTVSSLELNNLIYPLHTLVVNQNTQSLGNFETALFSFYNNPRMSINNRGVAINTFERTTNPNQALTVKGDVSASGGMNLEGTLNLGLDTNIYRFGTNILKTDDNFNVGILATGNTDSVITHNSNTLQQRNINPRAWDTTATFLSGSPTVNQIVKLTNTNTIGDTIITDTGTNVGINTTTPNERLTVVGNISSNAALQLSEGTTQSNGIQFGTDTNIYRSASNSLKTDDSLEVHLNLNVNGNTTLGSDNTDTVNILAAPINLTNATSDTKALIFGNDTNLYRPNADLLKTDDSLEVTLNLRVSGDTILGDTAGDTVTILAGPINLTNATQASDALVFGTDTNLYRPNADLLKTDDSLEVTLNLRVSGDTILGNNNSDTVTILAGPINLTNATQASDALVFGTDTNLYRSTTDTLRTDDNFVVGTLATNTNGNSIIVENSGKLEKRTVNPDIWDTNANFVSAVSLNSFTPNRVLKASNAAGITNSIITDNGSRVSIGTLNYSPTAVLDVMGTIAFGDRYGVGTVGCGYLSQTWSASENFKFFTLGSTYFDPSVSRWITNPLSGWGSNNVVNVAGDTQGIKFYLQSSTGNFPLSSTTTDFNTTEKIRISMDGNVGIGTTVTNEKLTVNGNISANGGIILNSANTDATGIRFGSDVNLYRSNTNTLQTDDTFVIGQSAVILGTFLQNANTSNAVAVRDTNTGTIVGKTINTRAWDTNATFLSGSPTTGRLARVTNTNTIGDSVIRDDGSFIGIGTAPVNNIQLTIQGNAANNAAAELRIQGSKGWIDFHNSARDGDYNGIVAADDKTIIFSDGVITSGNFVIAPWATGTGGIKIDRVGNVGIRQSTNITTGLMDEALHVGGNVKVGNLGISTANNVVTHLNGVLQQRAINPTVWNTNFSFVSGSTTHNTVLKGLGTNAVQNSNITDSGTTVSVAGNEFELKKSSGAVNFRLFNGATNNWLIDHNTTAGVLNFAYGAGGSNTNRLILDATNQLVNVPNRLLVNGAINNGSYSAIVNGNILAEDAYVFGDQIHARTLTRTISGSIGLVGHNHSSNATGYFYWNRPDGERMAYMGWNTSGQNNLHLQLERGAAFYVGGNTGRMGINTDHYPLPANFTVNGTISATNIVGDGVVPVGMIMAYTASTAPDGWLKCNGDIIPTTGSIQNVAASKLQALRDHLIANVPGNTTTTCSIPDLRGEFIRGWIDSRASIGDETGRVIGSAQSDAIRNITGSFAGVNGGSSVAYQWGFRPGSGTGAFSVPYSRGEYNKYAGLYYPAAGVGDNVNFNAGTQVPTASDNRPRNIALLYCIKY